MLIIGEHGHSTAGGRRHGWQLTRRISILRGPARRELLSPALTAARRAQGWMPRCMAWTLSRSLIVLVERLPANGITWPLLPTNLIMPVILLKRELADDALTEAALTARPGGAGGPACEPIAADETVCPTGATYVAPYGPARRRLAHILLHEAAHHCGAVWPEWRNWVNNLARRLLFFIKWRDRHFPVFPYASIYGAGVNSADTLAARLLGDAGSPHEPPVHP